MRKVVLVPVAVILAAGIFVAGRHSAGSNSESHRTAKRILYYVDPMHPAYRSDKPGIAPDCGMELEPVYEGQESAKNALPAGAVQIDPDQQRLIGVRVETVQKNPGSRVIRTLGRVEADSNLVHRVMSGTMGWVQSVQNNPPGTLLKKDEPLAAIYSPEFRNAEQAYLGSLATLERMKGGIELNDSSRTTDASLRINEEQLRALGMGEPQIRELAKNRQINRDITLTSPVDGIVLSRDVTPGERFDKGTEFYKIADLTKIWITADVFGEEADLFRPGARVRVSVRERKKTLYARVSENPPLFDPVSRTLKLRLQAENPGLLLRPDMFVDLDFEAKAPQGISVPQDSVLDSGMQKVVYVETSEGVFEARPVITGATFGSYVTISSGLKEGERIATAGNFLIDSESRLRHPVATSASTAPAAPAPIMQHEMKHAAMQPERKQTSPKTVETLTDPVCGMPLSGDQAKSSAHTEEFHGKTYRFCSDNCQAKFRKDPAKYVDAAPATVAGSLRAPRNE